MGRLSGAPVVAAVLVTQSCSCTDSTAVISDTPNVGPVNDHQVRCDCESSMFPGGAALHSRISSVQRREQSSWHQSARASSR